MRERAMSAEQADGFADNWAYLRTELHWLDRLLMTAVAKQRKETKEIDRVAQSKADRASSHWWKGVIVPDGKVSYDEYRQPAPAAVPKASYQHQIDAQIQESCKRGVVLALPTLCERLKLSLFEKNVVLMSLAPEVNRRYARLYRYLQGEDHATQTDLPTLDLVLRLLCKNDSEWRSSRNQLITHSPLLHYKLLDFLPVEDTLLNCRLKLAAPLVNYLLAECPAVLDLDALLVLPSRLIELPTESLELPEAELLKDFPQKTVSHKVLALPSSLQVNSPQTLLSDSLLCSSTVSIDWSRLVLPTATLEALQSLALRLQGAHKATECWGIVPEQFPDSGLLALLVGAKGTGKMLAASALATALQTSLVQVDLAIVQPADYTKLLEEITATAPKVLLIQSAQMWLKRSSQLSLIALQQFWQQRCAIPTLTLFSVTQQASVQVRWQQQMDQIVPFPMPNQQERLCLWQQAFPAEVPLNAKIDWQALAESPISGGEIQSIVHETITYAAMEEVPEVNTAHILKTLSLRQNRRSLRSAISRHQKTRMRT